MRGRVKSSWTPWSLVPSVTWKTTTKHIMVSGFFWIWRAESCLRKLWIFNFGSENGNHRHLKHLVQIISNTRARAQNRLMLRLTRSRFNNHLKLPPLPSFKGTLPHLRVLDGQVWVEIESGVALRLTKRSLITQHTTNTWMRLKQGNKQRHARTEKLRQMQMVYAMIERAPPYLGWTMPSWT